MEKVHNFTMALFNSLVVVESITCKKVLLLAVLSNEKNMVLL